MSGGEGSRVLIPSSERKVIQDIREIAGNHSDEEIYAMLLECGMDPNEAAQKLLFQDTFHEVKRRRERRKENAVNKEPHDNQWRAGLQGRGSRGGRGGYYPRHQSYDVGGANLIKGDVVNRATEKGVHVAHPEASSKLEVQVSRPDFVVDNPPKLESTGVPDDNLPPQISPDSISPSSEHRTVEERAEIPEEYEAGVEVLPLVIPGSDVTKYEHGNKEIFEYPLEGRHPLESPNIAAVAQKKEQKYIFSSVNKLSLTSSVRSQQAIGHQKGVAPNMEWKRKPTNQVPALVAVASDTPDLSPTVEKDDGPVVLESSRDPTLSASKLQQKLEDLHLAERQHVIIPDHLQVPESQRTGLSFGSFDVGFAGEIRSTLANGSSTARSTTFLSESYQGSINNARSTLSEHSASMSSQQENPDHSPTNVEIPPSKESDAPSSDPAITEQEESRHEAVLSLEGSQVLRMHTPPLYSAFGLVPPVLGGHFSAFEGAETQNREPSAVAGFIPFDPSANYYAQIYQPTADGDGRFSPYLAPNVSNYPGNTAAIPSFNSQLVQEGVSIPVISTAVNASTAQATGATLSSTSINQQPHYRQPGGVAVPQYPPNYFPYGHYYSPFYVPTPIHPFFSGTHFAQQPLPGGLYPPPSATSAASASMKYSPYKSGTGSGSPLPASQPRHSSPPSVNDDSSAAQYKENNVYIAGQQNEGSPVWIPASGRELAGLQTGSFYNISPAQPVNAFPGLYHPSQSLPQPVNALLHPPLTRPPATPEMPAPPSSAYQPPQRAQMNWAVNY